MCDFNEKTVLITGASSGVGRSAAIYFAGKGATVFAVARRKELLDKLAKEANGIAGSILPTPCDITNEKQLKQLATYVGAKKNHIDLLVNNAGVGMIAPLQLVNYDKIHSLMDINIISMILVIKIFMKLLQGGGAIVNIASVAAIVGEPGISAYAASKGAVISLTRSLAAELSRIGIRVNAIAPGFIKTDLLDKMTGLLSQQQFAEIEKKHLLGLGQAEDIINAIDFLGSDRAKWITGQVLIVDGGYSL